MTASQWHRKATRSRVGKAAKAAHWWVTECRKQERSWADPTMVPPSFTTAEELRVFRAVCGVLEQGYENRAADKRFVLRTRAARRTNRCPDCGALGMRRGHMDCQYPTNPPEDANA